jgi:hypothetical protein
MEVEFLRKRDYENKIRFTDLSSLDYNPIEHGNVKFADGMRKIRAILPDTNEVVTGVEVFRHVYRYYSISTQRRLRMHCLIPTHLLLPQSYRLGLDV